MNAEYLHYAQTSDSRRSGKEKNMEEQLAKSIDRRLRTVFWVLLPSAIVYLLVGILVLWALLDMRIDGNKTDEGKLVVPRVDLPAGTRLARTNLAYKTFPENEWPEYLVSPGHAFAVIGHTLVRPVAKGEPLDWYDTDVPIPLSSVAAEKVRHETEPEHPAQELSPAAPRQTKP
jgi:hypothetical protein